ncbi:MAG: Maltose/maltodextrin import ATP-binding protein MalK [Firmicutes bacterium ADurb.Bin506]|nr:MAG: Maltose/maltodextrin import ATP-binding protein MalK [Firmicutes bacterium ADurb.Bin506]
MFSSRNRHWVAPGARKRGLVFQSYALWPHLTVSENTAFGMRVERYREQ